VWGINNLNPLGNIADIQKGTSITKDKISKGTIPVVAGGKGIAYYHSTSNRDGNVITISASGASAGFVNYYSTPIFASDCITVKSKDENYILTELIYVLLQTIQPLIYELQKGQAQPHVYGEDIAKISIPVPPIDIQKQIVEEIEKIDEGVKNASNNILNLESRIVHLLKKIKSASNRRLGDIVTFKNGLNYDRNSNGDIIKIIGVGDFQNNKTPKWESLEDIEISGNLSEDYELHKNDLLVVRSNGSASLVGRFLLIDKEPHVKTSFSGFTIRLRLANKDIYDSKFLFHYLSSPITRDKLVKNTSGSNIKSLNQTLLSSIEIPMISFDEQKNIVSQIETLELEIIKARTLIANAVSEKQIILDKYLYNNE